MIRSRHLNHSCTEVFKKTNHSSVQRFLHHQKVHMGLCAPMVRTDWKKATQMMGFHWNSRMLFLMIIPVLRFYVAHCLRAQELLPWVFAISLPWQPRYLWGNKVGMLHHCYNCLFRNTIDVSRKALQIQIPFPSEYFSASSHAQHQKELQKKVCCLLARFSIWGGQIQTRTQMQKQAGKQEGRQTHARTHLLVVHSIRMVCRQLFLLIA